MRRAEKIYFGCSIRAGREDQPIYKEIIELIQWSGAIVLSELFANPDLMQSAHQQLTDITIHDKDLAMIRESHGLIMEVTNPSLGVGYEIGKAEEWGKPVLALFRPESGRHLSAMIAGSTHLQVATYHEVADLQAPIKQFITGL